MIKVGIIGVQGYAGEELVKILLKHPSAKIVYLADKMDKNKKIDSIYPYLKNKLDLECVNFEPGSPGLKSADVVFLALPHGVSLDIVAKIHNSGKKVIDLSADYRLKDAEVYEKWYGLKHTHTELLKIGVYGLPELYYEDIKKAQIVANPGCYPTSVILASAPLLKNDIVDYTKDIIIDSKSGFSGGGRKFANEYISAGSQNTFAYKVGRKHRHIPEIEQELSNLVIPLQGVPIKVTFTPHVVPQERGMYSSIYFDLKKTISLTDLIELYKQFYKNKPFVRIMPDGKIPETKSVVNTNYCEIGINIDESGSRLLVFSAIDNLVKGASGQAVQNMNIMLGLPETEGLPETAGF